MRWNNVAEIAEALEDSHPEEEVDRVRLAKLHQWVIELLDFEDDPGHGDERILEAVQAAWLGLREDK